MNYQAQAIDATSKRIQDLTHRFLCRLSDIKDKTYSGSAVSLEAELESYQVARDATIAAAYEAIDFISAMIGECDEWSNVRRTEQDQHNFRLTMLEVVNDALSDGDAWADQIADEIGADGSYEHRTVYAVGGRVVG